MRDEFSFPVFIDLGLIAVETAEMEVAVEIEPDETVLNTSWYIARIQVHGCPAGGKYRWFDVHERHPLYIQIRDHALAYRSGDLFDLWEGYLSEHPECRPLADLEEHGTHRVPA
jgi:hypothetical protein